MIYNKIWGSYTSKEIGELIEVDPVVVLPVGSYEQHGPHLTIDTDSNIISEIVKGAVEHSNVPCSFLSTIYVGLSEHHMYYPGSITLRTSTLEAIIYDIINSLHRHGIRRFLVINGHGGNTHVLNSTINSVATELSGEYIYLNYWSLVKDKVSEITKTNPKSAMDHAGELETALKLYLSPQDVRKDLIVPGITGRSKYWDPENTTNKITMFSPMHKITKYGHIGDPTKSTLQMGKLAFELIVSEVAELIETFYSGELGIRFR